MITITQVKTCTTLDLCWDSSTLRGKKRKENRDRDVQTQTERYEDYKCLRSSVNLHNQRQACPVNSNRLCVHLCQPVFTSVGTKTTSNLQERDTEKKDGKGRRPFQGPAGLLGVSWIKWEIEKKKQRERGVERQRGESKSMEEIWDRKTMASVQAEDKGFSSIHKHTCSPGPNSYTYFVSLSTDQTPTGPLCWCFSSPLRHSYREFMLLALPDFPCWNGYPSDYDYFSLKG